LSGSLDFSTIVCDNLQLATMTPRMGSNMKQVLFTGHGGFVGHHCLEYWLEKTDWEFVCLDSFRHKGTCRRVVEVGGDNPRIRTFKHDLSVPIDPQLSSLMKWQWKNPLAPFTHYSHPGVIINMASDSAVERSVTDPTACLRNNYDLMINMLEYARETKPRLFIHISTDEVYGEAPSTGGHKEWSPIMPSNPYAASKAAQEALAIAYWRTYKVPVVIVNIMNIIGERQDPEKFLPKIIQKVARDEEVPIYTDSENKIGSRVYIDAKNVADALVFLVNRDPTMYDPMRPVEQNRPDRYNICGDHEINNLDMAQMVAAIMGKELKHRMVPSESARPGYDKRYMLDGIKLRSLGWWPPVLFGMSLTRIVRWTLDHPHWLA
jgi:dTDP-glucose 4,6-dehydratase